jgi:hypothetical protein
MRLRLEALERSVTPRWIGAAGARSNYAPAAPVTRIRAAAQRER